MEIIQAKITKTELMKKHMNFFQSMTKAVVDVEKGIMALDADLHADLEALLLDQGSRQEYLWGINLHPLKDQNDFVEYTALINIRPWQENASMEIANPEIKQRVNHIVEALMDYAA